MKKYFIPVGVDLKLLAGQIQPLQKQTSLETIEDRLAYFIGIIYRQNLYRKDGDKFMDNMQEWVSLQATYLKKVLGVNYQIYRDVLQKNGVIEFNSSYSVGSQSMQYRINPTYLKTNHKQHIVKDRNLVTKIHGVEKALKKAKEKELKPYKSLVDVLEQGKLELDESGIKGWIEEEDIRYRGYYSLVQLGAITSEKNKDIVHPDIKKARNLQLAEDFLNHSYNCSSDHHFGCRLHSILTYSPSEFRGYLTHDGEQLVSLDLQNSQPYLLNGVLSAKFLCEDSKFSLKRLHPSLYKHLQNLKEKKKEIIEVSGYPVGIASEILDKASSKQLRPLSIMLQDTPKLLATQGLQFLNFSGLCQTGLYEQIQESFSGKFYHKNGEDKFSSRKSTKLQVMKLFYSDMKDWKTRKDLAPFRMFLKLFPAQGNLLLLLKSGHNKEDYKNAPMLLQRVESYLFLQVIAKKLVKKGIPVYTIHDSITVPVSYKSTAKQIMKQELTKHIGLVPTIKEEYWVNPRNNMEVIKEASSHSKCSLHTFLVNFIN